ncbi:MAG TPA: alpha/beta hydrolase [Patescibacteria group bacterium]|nr:alpha/beta hydrolase [Patescibacteria group bacterium]
MPSWQARCFTVAIRVLMRRLTWGDDRALARRARRVFGAPGPLQWLRTRAVRIDTVHDGRVRGEWIRAAGPEHGVILYFHAGGYVAGSPASDRPITAGLARLAGRRVFSLDYRLAPEHRFPAALDDGVAAYRWLLDQGTSPDSLALAGTSAGGGLALATLVRVRNEGLPLPACAVAFSPWTDLAGTGVSLQANDGRCPTFRPTSIPAFARAYLGDARRVHDKIRQAGGISRLEIFHDLFHAWPMLDGFMPEARVALQQAAAFINAAAVVAR